MTGNFTSSSLIQFDYWGNWSSSFLPYDGAFYDKLIFTHATDDRLYDITASDHTNGGGSAPYPQPIVIDTIGGNNANGKDFSTTDLGYWVNLGGGPTIYPWWLYGETE